MLSIPLLAVGCGHVALLARLVSAWRSDRRPGPGLLIALALPIAGMAYDAAVLALGRTLGEGSVLASLSMGRFVLHAFLTPLWVVAAGELAVGSLSRPRARASRGALLLIAVVLIAWEGSHLAGLEFAPAWCADTLRYTRARPGPPPVGAIGTLAVTIVLSPAISWRVTVAGLALLALSGLPVARVGPLPGSVGELVLAWSLVRASLPRSSQDRDARHEVHQHETERRP